jgi:predicted oxidoreductase
MTIQADVIIIGAGLSGLVAACELADAGKRTVILDQESDQNIGGQAFWSFGGLFLVNSPEQRRLGIKDSFELAYQDWMGAATFDRKEDYLPRQWAEAYLSFAAGEKRSWLRQKGIRFFPIVGWAERGGYNATGHGNSVPRFHITWGTGPGLIRPFINRVYEAVNKNLITLRFRHKATDLIVGNGTVKGVHGHILAPDPAPRGVKSSRTKNDEFSYYSQAVIIASGGIGANKELIRKNWPERLGKPPENMLCGVPDYVDGSMIEISRQAGAKIINKDRMWHYTEGIKNYDPVWSDHGIRILPGPSSLWFDACGNRLPVPLFPGFDTLGTLNYIMHSGYDYSWFILDQQIIRKEFALSGSEQNPDLTNRKWRQVLGRAFGKAATEPVEKFKRQGEDFIVKKNLEDLVNNMNELAGNDLLNYKTILNAVRSRDREVQNKFSKDLQIMAIRGARQYIGDKLIRTAKPHPILDPAEGPLIAVRLHILTRKTLGGLETNLSGQVMDECGNVIGGLYAAGEAAGFGGGGMHGYRSLEGTFLGGCIFSGRTAGREVAKAII